MASASPGRASTSSGPARSSRASTDFTIGLEEEFAIVDPETLELEHRFEELYAACQPDDLPRRVGRRRADRHRDRDPLGPRRDLRRGGRAPARAPRAGSSPSPSGGGSRWRRWARIPGRATSTSGSSTPSTTAGSHDELGWVAQRNNTWSLHVHVGVAGRRPGDRRLRPPARAAAAAAGALGELAVPRRARHRPALGAHRDLHPHLPALRRPRAVRRLERIRGLRRACSTRIGLDRRVDPALVERAPAPRASARSRSGSATRRPAARSRSPSPVWSPLRRAGGARLRRRAARPPRSRQREIEENLWRAIRYGLRRAADRLRRAKR